MKNKNEVYITFKTDPVTCNFLKIIAHRMGKTQPELINEICEDYIVNILSLLEEKGFIENQEE